MHGMKGSNIRINSTRFKVYFCVCYERQVRYMLHSTRFLIVTSNRKRKSLEFLINKNNECAVIEIIDYSMLNMTALSKYSMVLVCIESPSDLLRYMIMGDYNERIIHILNYDCDLLKRAQLDKRIYHAAGKLVETIEGLSDIVTGNSILTLNCSDILCFLKDKSVLCQITQGSKEVALYDMVCNWLHKRGMVSCLLHVTGKLVLQDVMDIYKWMKPTSPSEYMFGCKYCDVPWVRVFSFWTMEKV